MVFKKRRLSRRKFRRRAVGRTGRGRFRRTKKFVKAVIRRIAEVKYAFAFNAVVILNTVPFISSLVPVFPQGVDKFERLGNRIQYKFLQLRFEIQANVGAAAVSNNASIRFIVFWTRLPLSIPPAVTDVLDAVNYLSSIKNTNVRIVMDRTPCLGITGGLINTNRTTNILYKKKIKMFQNVNFSSAADSLPRDPKDNLYAMILTDSAVANDFTINFNWFSRMSYTDV